MPLNHFCFLPLSSSPNPSERNELKNYTPIISPSLGDPKNLLRCASCRSYLRDVRPPLTLSFLQSLLLCCSLLSSSLFSMVHGHIRFCQSHLWAVRIWMWMHPTGSVSLCVCVGVRVTMLRARGILGLLILHTPLVKLNMKMKVEGRERKSARVGACVCI